MMSGDFSKVYFSLHDTRGSETYIHFIKMLIGVDSCDVSEFQKEKKSAPLC